LRFPPSLRTFTVQSLLKRNGPANWVFARIEQAANDIELFCGVLMNTISAERCHAEYGIDIPCGE
jgi:hypothetical protein